MKNIHKLYSDICFNTCNKFDIDYDFFKNHFKQFLLNDYSDSDSKKLAADFVYNHLYRYDTLPQRSVLTILISNIKEYFKEMNRE